MSIKLVEIQQQEVVKLIKNIEKWNTKIFMTIFVAVSCICLLLIAVVPAQNIGTRGNNSMTGTITGNVMDAETDYPLENAMVTVEYHEILRKTYTDSNGQYMFKDVPQCFCLKNMTASKAGYMTQEIWVSVGDVTTVDFYLNSLQNSPEPTYGIVTGWVMDADTNKPIEKAEMKLMYHESTRVEYTDSNGQYTFENVPICFCLKNISATMGGYASQYQLIAVSEVTYVNFSLKPCEEPENPDEPDNHDKTHGTITGMVKDAKANKPIENALMTLKYHDLVRFQFTDSMGKYTFSEVPICFCLKNISAAKSNYESEFKMVPVDTITYVNFTLVPIDESQDPEDPKEPEDPEEPEEPKEPEKYNGVVTGVVIDATTNVPIEDVKIILEYHEIVRNTNTDSEGKYSFDNVPECNCSKYISAMKDGYEAQVVQIGVYGVTYVNFSLAPLDDHKEPHDPDEPGDNEQKDPEDEDGLYGVITGFVIDAKTNKPISNASLTLIYHDKTRREITDSNGKYSFTKVPICFCLKNISAAKNGYDGEYQLVAVSEITYANFSLQAGQDDSDDLIDKTEGDSDNIPSIPQGKSSPMESKNQLGVIIGIIGILASVIIIWALIYTSKKRLNK